MNKHHLQYLIVWENKSTKFLYTLQARCFSLSPEGLTFWSKCIRRGWQVREDWGFCFWFFLLECTALSYLPHCPSESTCVQSSSEFFCFTGKAVQVAFKIRICGSGDWQMFPSQAVPFSHKGTGLACWGTRAPREHTLASDAQGLSSCCSDNESGTTTVENWCNRTEGIASTGS